MSFPFQVLVVHAFSWLVKNVSAAYAITPALVLTCHFATTLAALPPGLHGGGRVRRVARHAVIYINLQLFMLSFIGGKEFTFEIYVTFFFLLFF